MNKGAIQRFAIWARTELIAQVSQRAYQYGITKDGYGEQNAVTVGGRALTTDEQRQRKELVDLCAVILLTGGKALFCVFCVFFDPFNV